MKLFFAVSNVAMDAFIEVELPLPTFTATAEMAGISRVMGGYHIQADNIEGLKLGRSVADFVWSRIQAERDGTLYAVHCNGNTRVEPCVGLTAG